MASTAATAAAVATAVTAALSVVTVEETFPAVRETERAKHMRLSLSYASLQCARLLPEAQAHCPTLCLGNTNSPAHPTAPAHPDHW
eukprot:5706502-Prymnesium_polylepis.1